jgi:DNA-directed RNA polymerase II subunit RPB1
VEAARQAVFNEMRDVISFDGSYVNYRHLALLADTMCMSGSIMPVTRHGINKTAKGMLTTSSLHFTAFGLHSALLQYHTGFGYRTF